MFVAAWKPGLNPSMPALTSVPVWLEFRGVPPHFFSEEGLEHVAGALGIPVHLHPLTANMTNLEVAKVFTIINPLKPLPEAMNIQFESGEIHRVEVSCPWLPPICNHCSAIGHSIRRCPSAPITCSTCKSSAHTDEACPRAKKAVEKAKELSEAVLVQVPSPRKNPDRSKKEKRRKGFATKTAPEGIVIQEPSAPLQRGPGTSKSGQKNSKSHISSAVKGKKHVSSADKYLLQPGTSPANSSPISSSSSEEDSSDVEPVDDYSSPDSEEEDNQVDDAQFMEVVSKKLQLKKSGSAGNHPKPPSSRTT